MSASMSYDNVQFDFKLIRIKVEWGTFESNSHLRTIESPTHAANRRST